MGKFFSSMVNYRYIQKVTEEPWREDEEKDGVWMEEYTVPEERNQEITKARKFALLKV